MLFKRINDHIKTQGLQKQLSFSFIVSFISFSVFIILCAAALSYQLVTDNFQKQGLVITELLAKQSSLALTYSSTENAAQAAQLALELPNVVQVEIFDNQHHLFYRQATKEYFSDNEKHPYETNNNHDHYKVSLQNESPNYWFFTAGVSIGENSNSPYEQNNIEKIQLGHVRVVLSKTALHAMVGKMVSGITAVAVVVMSLMLLLQRRLMIQLTKPLYRLIESMDNIREQSQWQNISTHGAPEWVQIYKAFNQMMKALHQQEKDIKQARDEALETSRLKSEFAANISHELRTPMNGILGMMELLSTQKLDKNAHDYVELAKSSGEQLHLLINDILDFSKLDAGHMQINESVFDLAQLIEELTTVHAYSFQAKKLRLNSIFPANLDHHIIGDENRLRQLLNNLIGNAVKFTSSGDVTVEVKKLPNVPDDDEVDNTIRLQLTIADSGIGIADQYQQSIFAAYSQQDGATNRKFGGTGLGLAICKGIVELMQGDIFVRSEEGKGSEFIIELPFHCAPASATQKTKQTLPQEHHTQAVILSSSIALTKALGCRLEQLSIPFKRHIYNDDLPALLAMHNKHPLLLFIDKQIFSQDIDFLQLNTALNLIKSMQNIYMIEVNQQQHKTIPACNGVLNTPIRSAHVENIISQYLNPQANELSNLPSNQTKQWFEKNPLQTPSQLKVLIVEDNIINQKVALGMLNKLGIQPDIANDGAEAIIATEKQSYDLIFMDCQMPTVDGYQATETIRKMTGIQQMPIIALTANTSTEDIDRCQTSGMNDYIAKPVRLQLLQDVLERWIPVNNDI